VPCCQKYTPIDCFFGDFTHWEPKDNVHIVRTKSSIWLYCVNKKEFHVQKSFNP